MTNTSGIRKPGKKSQPHQMLGVKALLGDDLSETKRFLESIQPRLISTRPIDEKHVVELSESIAALGLLQPIIVDEQNVLVAGEHRLAAIKLLKESDIPELNDAYRKHFPDDEVPVRVLSFSVHDKPEQALQIELAENEKRKNYTKEQIVSLADRLKALGYHDVPGRPAMGSKALGPALSIAIGVSTRYVRKVLNQEFSPPSEQTVFERYKKALKRLDRALEELMNIDELGETVKADEYLTKAIPSFRSKVENALHAKR